MISLLASDFPALFPSADGVLIDRGRLGDRLRLATPAAIFLVPMLFVVLSLLLIESNAYCHGWAVSPVFSFSLAAPTNAGSVLDLIVPASSSIADLGCSSFCHCRYSRTGRTPPLCGLSHSHPTEVSLAAYSLTCHAGRSPVDPTLRISPEQIP